MNEKLNETFKDFENQVSQIADHADTVNKLHFSCSLKNGTGFNFDYDCDKFNQTGKQEYKPADVFNAVIDILAGAISLALLVLFFIGVFPQNDSMNATTFLQKCLFPSAIIIFNAYFVTDAVYHLLPKKRLSRKTMFTVCQGLKLVAFVLATLTYTALVKPQVFSINLFVTFIIAGVGLMFLTMGTKTSMTLHQIMCAILPFTILLADHSIIGIASAVLFTTSSLIYIVVKDERETKTNPIFMTLGFVAYILLLNAMPLV